MGGAADNGNAASGGAAQTYGYNGRIRPTRLEIDLDCLAWNTRQIRSITGAGVKICASMKSNAYGHGAPRAAGTVLSNGAERLSVAFLDEALELRSAGVGAPILILGALEPSGADEIVANGFTQTVSSEEDFISLSEAAARLKSRAFVHIKADTGMGRLGFAFDGARSYDGVFAACRLPGISVEGIFTHFSTADETDAAFTIRQLDLFNAICGELSARGLKIPVRHCSNSAAIDGFPQSHMEMVRPGIALYGGAGRLPGTHHKNPPYKRVMSLRTKVALVKTIPPGASVGYGRRYTAVKTARIATLPLGYGDGYNRGLSCGKGEVLIRGRRFPVAGTICMDQCMVDVTGADDIRIGDEAVLFGKQGADEITLEEISVILNTIPYEIMCAISRRVPRVYVQNGEPAGHANYLHRNI